MLNVRLYNVCELGSWVSYGISYGLGSWDCGLAILATLLSCLFGQ